MSTGTMETLAYPHMQHTKSPYLNETDIGRLLAEALATDVETVLADETGLVGTDTAITPHQHYPHTFSRGKKFAYHCLLPFPYVRGREYQTVS